MVEEDVFRCCLPSNYFEKNLAAVIDKFLTSFGIIAGIVIGFYLIIILLAFFLQSNFIFFPKKHIDQTPDLLSLKYEDVFFRADDNIKLHGWWIPAMNSRGVILFFHGNAGNISHRLESIQSFNKIGLSVFIFDYRGYGLSEGKISEAGLYSDAEASWKYLTETRNFKSSAIIIFGRSLGGAIATWLAKAYEPAALIIESTFTSVKETAAEFYPFLPVKLLLRFNFNTIGLISEVKCPILVIHSRDDELISFTHGLRLFKAATQEKEFLEIRGSHNNGFYYSAETYKLGLENFISKHLFF